MNIFAPNNTDGYKLGHPSQYAVGTSSVSSNFTPRDFGYANVLPETRTNKMVYAGLQYAMKAYLIDNWNATFFSQPKEKVIAKYARRIKNYLGTNQGQESIKMLRAVHDLGYLPLRIKSLPEGARVNAGIPVFITACTKPDFDTTYPAFGALVNYVETVLSNSVWPICNSASLMEQYYLLAKKYGALTGASNEFWLPFAIHNFSMRGMRGVEDAIMSAFGHSLFHKGTDTFAVIDFIEDYYNGNSDFELIGASINATEHATVCQQIAVHGGGHDGEVGALKHFLTEVYPSGPFAYVADSRDYWDVIENISAELRDVIMARGPNVDGLPGVLTFRPDSSKDTPYEVIMGYKVLDVTYLNDWDTVDTFEDDDYNAVRYEGKLYTAEVEYDSGYDGYRDNLRLELGRELGEAEAKGTLQTLWDIFGGTEVKGSDGLCKYRLLDSHIRIIYGEAISLQMAQKIYKGMMEAGWSVGSVFFGVGSWAFLANSSRDSYGVACKATNSEVNGVDYPLQKDPKGTSSFKKSARGRLRVELDDKGDYVLFDNQTPEQEEGGELKEVFLNSTITSEVIFREMVARLQS
jgi:nicotinamide phosphoribosyltransferase